MAVDQSEPREGVPERFSPADMSGLLLEAEHLVRYRWATSIAAGKRVLDAGCGTAYGTAMLAAGGAAEVVGVDIAEGVLESARPEMPEAVELVAGDLRDLELEDGRFDLVVCFEVIEHFHEPQKVLDELVRVLEPGGVLLVSSPNRGVYPEGNPFHYHEFKPDELEAELQRRLANVHLVRQQSYVTAAILEDDAFAAGGDAPLSDLALSKLPAEAPGGELFTLAVASEGPLPSMPSLATITGRVALDEWLAASAGQEQALRDQRRQIDELQIKASELPKLQEQLIQVEQDAAQLPTLRYEVEELTKARDVLLQSARELEAAKASFSWRVTRPLREGRGFLGRFLRRR